MYKSYVTALVMGAAFFSLGSSVYAASCCGGGSSTSLILPKFSTAMIDVSFDWEKYDGQWGADGDVTPDPDGTDLNQYRLNIGYAHRLASRWQASVILPYVWNDNQYGAFTERQDGLGDTTVNLWYEAFDGVTCVWKVKKPEDLKPAAYFGASLTIPTGVSRHDDVERVQDTTGLGFYRLDVNMLLEKTIYPFSASIQLSYGKYIERSVNREDGRFVEPYDKVLGDRLLATTMLGYTQFLDSMNTITYTVGYAHLEEDEGEINGRTDPTSGFEKRSFSVGAAFATMDRDWVVKLSWSQAIDRDGWGEKFPITDVYTIGVSHVLR